MLESRKQNSGEQAETVITMLIPTVDIEKKRLSLPSEIVNIIKCKNPRCITSIEQGLKHVFVLSDETKQVYRCKYCEEKYS